MRGGRIVLGLNGPRYFSGVFPFINILKQTEEVELKNSGGSTIGRASIRPGVAGSAWDAVGGDALPYIDANGDLANPLSTDVSQMIRFFYSNNNSIAAGLDLVGTSWVLKWDGTANANVEVANSEVQVGSRVTFTWASNTLSNWITFSSIDHDDPPRNIVLCRAEHEALHDAGELFNPEWVAEVKAASGAVRFMDWQQTNGNVSTRTFAHMQKDNFFTWTAWAILGMGCPASVMVGCANEVESSPWICIPGEFGTPKVGAIAAATKANPCVITALGHEFANGDQVLIYSASGMTQLNQNVYTVANANIASGTFELQGVNSTAFGTYTGSGRISQPHNLTSIGTEIALLAAYVRDNADVTPHIYELSNEVWNSGFGQFHLFQAQGKVRYGADLNGGKEYGYIAAHCMKVIRDTYGVENRANWKGVLGTHTHGIGQTNSILEGVQDYIDENAPSLAISDLFDDLGLTNYWAGANFSVANSSVILALLTESESRHAQGLEPHAYEYFTREICADTLPFASDNTQNEGEDPWTSQASIAAANGLGILPYEGGDHNTITSLYNSLSTPNKARLLLAYRHYSHHALNAANFRASFENAVDTHGAIMASKFVEGSGVSEFGNWGGMRYVGDSNPVWTEVKRFNSERRLWRLNLTGV